MTGRLGESFCFLLQGNRRNNCSVVVCEREVSALPKVLHTLPNVNQGTGLLLGGVPAMLLVRKLVQVHDAFQLRQEMLWMMGTCLFCVGKHRRVPASIMSLSETFVIYGTFFDEHTPPSPC